MRPPSTLVADAHAAGLRVHPWTFRAENFFLPASFAQRHQSARSWPSFGRYWALSGSWHRRLLHRFHCDRRRSTGCPGTSERNDHAQVPVAGDAAPPLLAGGCVRTIASVVDRPGQDCKPGRRSTGRPPARTKPIATPAASSARPTRSAPRKNARPGAKKSATGTGTGTGLTTPGRAFILSPPAPSRSPAAPRAGPARPYGCCARGCCAPPAPDR